jgi:uncharacterized membrane protein YoaK (UPF0700 family)
MIVLPEAARMPLIALTVLAFAVLFIIIFRRYVVRAVLWTSELLVLLSVVFFTIMSGVLGAFGGFYFNVAQGNGYTSDNPFIWLAMIAGAIVGFLMSLLWASFMLWLSQIERNTKQMAILLDRVINRPPV